MIQKSSASRWAIATSCAAALVVLVIGAAIFVPLPWGLGPVAVPQGPPDYVCAEFSIATLHSPTLVRPGVQEATMRRIRPFSASAPAGPDEWAIYASSRELANYVKHEIEYGPGVLSTLEKWSKYGMADAVDIVGVRSRPGQPSEFVSGRAIWISMSVTGGEHTARP